MKRSGAVLVGVVVAVALAVMAPAAMARDAYVTNYDSDTVSVIDTATGAITANIPIGTDTGPYTIAIAPNGGTAYSVNYDSNTVTAINTQTKSVIGAPIPVGKNPLGIAIAPNALRAYVANSNGESLSVIDLQTGQPVGLPVPLPGTRPQGVAVSLDGSRVFIADNTGSEVYVLDTATNQLVGTPIVVGEGPYGLAITPDGKKLYTANNDDESVSVVDVATGQVQGGPIKVGKDASGVAITPDGTRAYVANYTTGSVSVIDTATNAVVGTIGGIEEAEFVAITPNGQRAFVSQYDPGGVTPLALPANVPLGPTIKTGEGTGQVAIVPDQPPIASFGTVAKRVRPGVASELSTAGSIDPDGTVASYAWTFGDGSAATVTTPTVKHTFAKPGKYAVSVKLTDNEGCSTAFVFTGQTAYCNGSAGAVLTKTIVVAYPGLKVKCPASAKPGGCKLAVRAVSVKGGKKKKIKAQSGYARAKVKGGKSATLRLKPRKAFAKKLAKAKKILVEETRTIDGEKTTRIRKLPVVG
ncbi:MAG TPA: PKD domain-containing protein [Solirubrobacterales bacterium]|nr:PKD domain-containing protein [Solirubrobacterales bacterium]